MVSASFRSFPLIRLVIWRALRGAMRTYRATALASTGSILLHGTSRAGVPSPHTAAPFRLDVPAVRAGAGELRQLVAHPVSADVHGHVLAPVVHRDGVTHHLRENGGRPGRRADDPLFPALVHGADLFQQLRMCVGPLLKPSSHMVSPSLAPAPLAYDVGVRLLPLLARPVAQGGLAPRRHRARAADGSLALAAPVGVIDRVHRRTPGVGPPAQIAVPARLTQVDVFVLHVAHLAHRGPAIQVDAPKLPRRKPDGGVVA